MIRPLLVAVVACTAGLAACTSTTTTTSTTTGAPAAQEDPVTSSGECVVAGYDCSTVGAACKDKCYPTDGRKDAYVAFLVSGKALDSRAVPFAPVASGDRTLRYGCGLFTATDGMQGLELLYRKNEAGAAFSDDTTVRIDGFASAGSYTATVRYTPSDTAQTAGDIYAKRGGCSVDVKGDGHGGITGTLSCPNVPDPNDGSTVSISGDFACGGTALEPITVALP